MLLWLGRAYAADYSNSRAVAITDAPDPLAIQGDHVSLDETGSGSAIEDEPTIPARNSPFVLSAPKAVPPFPILLNQNVRRYIDAFLNSPDGLQDSFDRSRPYLGEMVRVLRSYGVPDDLVYLAFAESAFTGQEKGIWQFNAQTARRFGLHVDSWVDERRDPVMSTRAAAEYLATLHDAAGYDWRVAVVGWNNGDNAIDRYWSMRGGNFDRLINKLPRRTRALLGRFMAVAYIAHHAASYGLSLVSYDAAPAFRQIRVQGGVALRVLAAEYGTTVGRIRELNPALERNFVPPWAHSYPVRMPMMSHASADSPRF
jgi:membrane-bound lytic murein transglycosylase D